jgi:acyl-CoA synthetase (AMP-forming)/AMP-acid ligase II
MTSRRSPPTVTFRTLRSCRMIIVAGAPCPMIVKEQAAIQPHPGEVLTENEVVDFARRHLADFKAPRSVSFHADFPRDTAGKLLKRLLREPYWAGRRARV